jgi:hypothetical protein
MDTSSSLVPTFLFGGERRQWEDATKINRIAFLVLRGKCRGRKTRRRNRR